MNRSVYSLVLSDDVVEAVDRLAYQQNTSRSALINQILAEAVSFVTPEMRMREIFSQVEALMDGMDAFQVNTQPSDAILSIKSPLRYKYKPTLRYAVELYRAPRPAIGELRVSARTQSQGLLESLTGFYQLWIQLETHYIGSRFPGGEIPCQVQEGRYCRQFFLPRGEIGSEELARAITDYIRMFDHLLKVYFNHLDDCQAARAAVEQEYRSYLSRERTVL